MSEIVPGVNVDKTFFSRLRPGSFKSVFDERYVRYLERSLESTIPTEFNLAAEVALTEALRVDSSLKLDQVIKRLFPGSQWNLVQKRYVLLKGLMVSSVKLVVAQENILQSRQLNVTRVLEEVAYDVGLRTRVVNKIYDGMLINTYPPESQLSQEAEAKLNERRGEYIALKADFLDARNRTKKYLAFSKSLMGKVWRVEGSSWMLEGKVPMSRGKMLSQITGNVFGNIADDVERYFQPGRQFLGDNVQRIKEIAAGFKNS